MDLRDKDCVEFKGTGNGLVLYVHKETPLENILDIISYRIKSSPRFFEEAILTEISSNYLSPYQKNLIIDYLWENFNVKYIGIDEFSFNEMMKKKEYKGASAIFKAVRTLYIMDLNEGDEVDYNGSIIVMTTVPRNVIIKSSVDTVVLGSVEVESSIVSGGNIIVMGELRGSAYAGAYGNDSACIIARKISAEKLAIYDCQSDIVINQRETAMTNPEICYIDENKKIRVSQKKEILYKYSPGSINDISHGSFDIEEQGIMMEKNERFSDYRLNFKYDDLDYSDKFDSDRKDYDNDKEFYSIDDYKDEEDLYLEEDEFDNIDSREYNLLEEKKDSLINKIKNIETKKFSFNKLKNFFIEEEPLFEGESEDEGDEDSIITTEEDKDKMVKEDEDRL